MSVTIKGHAVSAAFVSDHTYVTSSDRGYWPCTLDKVGGSEVCEGTCERAQVDAIAGPDGLTGIQYDYTGVCHQMANRLLAPAGLVVAGVRGYRRSVFAFSTYGLPDSTTKTYPKALVKALVDHPQKHLRWYHRLRLPTPLVASYRGVKKAYRGWMKWLAGKEEGS